MDKIRFRDLQRWKIGDILTVLPIAVTSDSQAVMVIATLEQWNKLVKEYKLAPSDSHRANNDSQ